MADAPHARSLSPETLAAQAMQLHDAATGGVIPPVQTSTTYLRDADY